MSNILLAGVGGQGTILPGKIMGDLLVGAGYDVKISEIHGMSQRGGSVVTYVKFGEKVFSPTIETGEADVIVAFEQLEAARWLMLLKPGGTVIMNTQKIMPMPVITGVAAYPTDLENKIKESGAHTVFLDAAAKAREAENLRAVNLVLLGVLSSFMPFSKGKWLKSIENSVSPATVKSNKAAFLLGRRVGK